MMSTSSAARVQKYRSKLRARGLKSIQIWVPDVKSKGFQDECKRQSLLAKNDEHEQEINEFISQATDLRGWE